MAKVDFRYWNWFLAICYISLVVSCEPKEIKVSEGNLLINGSEIYYKTVGEGEPLLIVHGGPILDHSYFLPHLENLARDYQLIFYDQRASGRSSIQVDSSRMNLKSFVEDIDIIREQLGHSKINLLGHSWGGLIAMIYGIEHGDRLDHLILSNSMASNVMDWQAESGAVAALQTDQDKSERDEILRQIRGEEGERNNLIRQFLLTSFKPQMYIRENLDKLALYVPQDYDDRSALYRLLGPDLANFDYDDALRNIQCPTLIIYGELEPAVEIYANKMVDLIPNAALSVIEKSGHFPFIEQPEEFKKVVSGFLENKSLSK